MKTKMTSFVIGIDVGTTSIKGMLMNGMGEMVAFAKQEYSLDSSEGDICELDAEIYWEISCRVIRQLVSDSSVDRNDIAGIAFSGQGETLIVVDSNGNPLRKAIVWPDTRSIVEAEDIKKRFDPQQVMNITGQPEVVPMWPATRILWLKKNESDIFSRTAKYLLVEDFLIFRLTGKYCTEHSLSSSTLYLDISQKIWWQEMLDFLCISDKQLPTLYPSGKVIGTLTPDAALATGLYETTRCITGAYDHPAAAIGSGNIHNGDVTLAIGASMAMCIALDQPVFDCSMNLPCQCHAIDGMYFLLPYEPTAGLALKWFKDTFGQQEVLEAERNGGDAYHLLDQYAEKAPVGSDGLMMLPYFAGTGSLECNPKVKGVFAGITLGMTKGHFVRAILESVSLMVRHHLEAMKNKGIDIQVIRIVGGASKSALWNQMLADVTGLPVLTLRNVENSVMGACLLAAVGSGIFEDLKTACQAAVQTNSRYNPDRSNGRLYNEIYGKYVNLYKSLEDYWNL